MKRYGVIAAIFLLPLSAVAQPCELGLPGETRLESERYFLAFRTVPGKLEVGRHFALEFVLCPKAGAGALQSVRVDAHMPAHRHGMNYAAQLTPALQERYTARGLMFHMPGRWELFFDVRSGDKTDRLSQSVLLE